MIYNNIFDYIKGKENEYQQSISLNGWEWNMPEHIRTGFFYKHGRLLNGNDENTPVKNITKPLLNLQYRAEDVDVADIVLYVDDPDSYHLSFLVKKYHDDVFIVENDLDSFIDSINESKVDYGLGLAKEVKGVRPDAVDLQSIAFCDQTNVLKGPIAIKHFYNPEELLDMKEKGWGNPANGATATVEELITLAEENVDATGFTEQENKTPGAYIEVYEIHGVLPQSYLDDSDSDKYKRQMQIVGFYNGKDGEKHGVTLFRQAEKKNPFKAIVRDFIPSRACGWGGAEEIVEPQVWTNYSIIRQKEMLDAASKTVLKAIGADLKSRYPNGLKDVDNLQVIELNEGEDIGQIDTTPRSMILFENFERAMMDNAQLNASATDPLLGQPSPSGTPFRSQERQVIEGKGIHEYRRGKYAKWLEEVYRDWFLPYIISEITNGKRFLAELSTDEMNFVADRLVTNRANDFIKERILKGEVVDPQEVEAYKQVVRDEFIKGGNKKFIEILKGEFKNKPIRVKISIAGKQKDLQFATDRIVNIFRQIFANPQGFSQVMQIPGMAKNFNDLLEYSGMSPAYFTGLIPPQQPQPVPTELNAQQLQTNVTQNA